MKEFVRRSFPRAFGVLRDAKDRLLIEYRVLRHLRAADLGRVIARGRSDWWRELPVQSARRFDIGGEIGADMATWLERQGVAGTAGGHSVYLPPDVWRRSPLSEIARGYPGGAGLKIARNPGSADMNLPLHGSGHSVVQRQLLHSPRHLMLVGNLLHRRGLGPRFYDVIELRSGTVVWPAFVLADVPGRAPSGASCLEGVAGLQRLVTDGTVALVAPEGFAHSDFRCPECGGNALTDEAGRFQYVDAQNFVLSDYRSELLRVGRAVAADSHFGDRSWLRGGAYLYQSIPGIPLAAKRRIDVRSGRWLALLERYGESLDGRVVLDVGCNLGGLMGVYLGAGAAWCHGWDRPNVVERTREVLLAVGAGRFSLTGGELSTSRALEADLPPHVRANLNGCAVSYLSVRRHLGWLESLTALPWRLMLYEGHEGEGRTETEGFLTALRKRVAFESLELVEDRDGDSLPRFRALLRRTDLPGPGRPA